MNQLTVAFMGLPGHWEVLVILVIALLIFGKKLPEVGRGLGKGIVEFKKGLKGVRDELDDVDREIDDAVDKSETKKPAQLQADLDDDEVESAVSEKPKNQPVAEKRTDAEKAEA